MRLREAINRKPATAIAVSVVVIALVLVFIAMRAGGEREASSSSSGPKAWYTVDDGRTWFADAANKMVPFDHGGKPAYRCYVWSCDGGKTKFVSHLERVKADTLGVLTRAGKTRVEFLEMPPGSQQVKPAGAGDAEWRDVTDPGAVTISTPRCPAGSAS